MSNFVQPWGSGAYGEPALGLDEQPEPVAAVTAQPAVATVPPKRVSPTYKYTPRKKRILDEEYFTAQDPPALTARQEFEMRVGERVKAGMPRAQAIRVTLAADDLRRRWIAEANRK